MELITIFFLVSHGANAVFAAVLIFTTIRLYRKSQIGLVLMMSILMISWCFTNILLLLPGILSIASSTHPLVIYIATWNIIGSAIVPSVFIIFIDGFEGEIDAKKTAVAVATIVATIFIAISGLTSNQIDLAATIIIPENTNLVTMRWSPLSSVAIFPTVLLCGYWTQIELLKSKIHAIDIKQLTQIKYMRIGGILMFFVGPAFGILGVVLVDGFELEIAGTWASEIVGYLFVSVGIFMVTIAYTRSDAVAFLQPQRIETLLAIYSTGIPVLQYNFIENPDQQTELSLVSGAITAITALMSEAFNVRSNVKEIVFFDKELMLEFHNLDNDTDLAFILITERHSAFLRNSLKRFLNEFIKNFDIGSFDGVMLNEEERSRANELVRISFGLESLDIK